MFVENSIFMLLYINNTTEFLCDLVSLLTKTSKNQNIKIYIKNSFIKVQLKT